MRKPFWQRALRSLTEFRFVFLIFISTILILNLIGLCWYSTVILQTPTIPEETCKEFVIAVFGAISVKVLGNIFEHNDGSIFGTSNMGKDEYDN